MTLNYIWWWGSSPEFLENVEYHFIAITQKSILTWSQIDVWVKSIGQLELFSHLLKIIIICNLKLFGELELFVFDKNSSWIELLMLNSNIWNHFTNKW